MKKSKPISNISTIIQMAILFAASIHGANAQNSATGNLQYQRNDVMGKDSTSLVPNTQMGTVQNFTNTSTSSYTSPPPPPPPPPTCQEDFTNNPLPPCGYVQPPNPSCTAGGWNMQWLSGRCGFRP